MMELKPGTQITYQGSRGKEYGFVEFVEGVICYCRFWSNTWGILRTKGNAEAVYTYNLIVDNSGPQEIVEMVLYSILEVPRSELRTYIEHLEKQYGIRVDTNSPQSEALRAERRAMRSKIASLNQLYPYTRFLENPRDSKV